MRLLLGLTQMVFSVTALCLMAFDGFHWRAGVALFVAAVAAAVSRSLYAGRPDPRLEASLDSEIANDERGKR